MRALLVIPIEAPASDFSKLRALGFELMETKIRSDDELYLWLFPLMLYLCWRLPNTQQIFARTVPTAEAMQQPVDLTARQQRSGKMIWQPSKRWAVFIALAAAASLLSLQRVSEFLYFQF